MRRIATFLVLAAAVLLQGCHLSHANIRRADAIVDVSEIHTSACHRDDHCAQPSALLDLGTQALTQSTPAAPVHRIGLLEDGESAMVARINLIRGARRSIDVQTYIWEQDDAGKLVLDQLVEAAARGVKVRILADQLFSFGDADLLATMARTNQNLQMRLYNPTFRKAHTPPLEFAASIACCFLRFNQRMHNKLIVVDDTVGITGGRNYEDRYFDWNADFDYRDRDIVVAGPAAQEMADSFDLFWNHKRSIPLTHLRDVNKQLRRDGAGAPRWVEPAYERPDRVALVMAQSADPQWIDDHLVAPSMTVGKVDYLSDLPGKTEEPKQRDERELTRRIMGMITGAKSEVLLQTPYLVLSSRAKKIFRALYKRPNPPRVIVSTNSLASTDAFAVYAISYKHRKRYLTKYGFEIYEMKPQLPADREQEHQSDSEYPTYDVSHMASSTAREAPSEEMRGLFGSRGGKGQRSRPAPLRTAGTRTGLHAKSIVIDDTFAMVGTHNFDPRSDHYNTESGVVVYDHAFAEALRASIMSDVTPENSWVIAPRKPTVAVLDDISGAIGDVSERLPLFDLWPFRYATSYDLKPGCTPKRPDDPDFFRCYRAVGDFPDVNLSFKLIYTRLLTAFGGGASGIL